LSVIIYSTTNFHFRPGKLEHARSVSRRSRSRSCAIPHSQS